MQTIVQDIAYGLRMMRRSPAFTLIAVFTLALGIGANTAIFSIVQAVLLRPLPYRDPSRLVLTFDAPVHNRESKIFVPYRHFLEWASKNHSYEGMAAETWIRGPRFLLGRGAPQSILAVPVTEDFFSVLGVPPQIGRTFNRDDLTKGCAVVLSHTFWQDHLGAQADILGQRLTLEDSSCTVLGIMPAGFAFYPLPTDMWTLITPGSDFDRNNDRNGVAVFGRLRPGVSMAAAEAELNSLAHAVDNGRAFGVDSEPVSFNLQEEFTWLSGRNLRLSIQVLFAAVSLVLLIACVNVASLLLTRLLSRQREMAIRTALGSGRIRLLRQLLTESLLLCIAAGILGSAIATGAVRYFRALNPVELPPGAVPAIDLPVLCYTMVLALLTPLVFGLIPAWNGSKVSVIEAIKSGARSSAGPAGLRLAKGLISVEIMLSLVLLAGAAMLIRSVANFSSAPLGFSPERLIAMTVNLPAGSGVKPEQRTAAYDRIRSAVQSMPGVEATGMSTRLALKGSNGISGVLVEGRPSVDPKNLILDTEQQYVTDGYFRFLGIPFLRGREFAYGDRGSSPAVVVVNSALVRKYFPGEDPMGKRIRLSGSPADSWLTIVGIAEDEKQTNAFREMDWAAPPIVYRPLAQQPADAVDMIVRLRAPETLSAAAIQQEIARVEPSARISGASPLRTIVDRHTAYPRFRAVLMGGFAALALLLALVGLYGVLSQLVARRTQEIGIRMALGARQKDVLRMILKQGALLAATGIAAGLMAAALLGRLIESLLYGVRPEDPATLAGVSVLLIAGVLLGTWIPARRAAGVNPVDSLRAE